MTKCTVKRASLTNFLSSFGPGVEDLRLNVSNNQLAGGVAVSTHFITQRIVVTQLEAGAIVIADLSKVQAFLRACSGEEVTLQQNVTDTKTGNLSLSCGNTKVTLPPTQEVKSSAGLAMASKLVDAASASNWTSFGDANLTGYGVIDIADLSAVSSLGKVVGADKPYTVSWMAQVSDLLIQTGAKVTGEMHHTVHFSMGDFNPEVDEVSSRFGPWFPEVLACLPPGKAEFYVGDGTVLVFNHQDVECLLVIIDQAGGEE
mgnify:FL=1|tara:strand:+ start:1445 stop:2221 length:777 start_codon:yes stop_codon:yes gene_type:complete